MIDPGGDPRLVDEAEVVVVGAGPAGSRCAGRLSELGHDVLLLDKDSFPRDKPCGDGLTTASVEILNRMGLDRLIAEGQEVRGSRVLLDHEVRIESSDRSARCIPRLDLDGNLLTAAIERGTRFAQVAVAGPSMNGETVEGVSTREGGVIRASCVIAADGATSRLRRTCGFAPTAVEKRAYAVRQYFRSERPLDPFFDIFAPLRFASSDLLGYGWVFPIDSHTANVGVGFYRQGPSGSPALTSVLEAFLEELERTEEGRYGVLIPVGEPLGSPVGIGFERGHCQFQRILFVGDAARMTDPFTGEGIGCAMVGAGLVADAAHAALTGSRGPDWHLGLGIGRELDRGLLRLGQDVDLLRRLGVRRLTRSSRLMEARGKVREAPFFRAAGHAVTSSYQMPELERTSVFAYAAEHNAGLAEALTSLNGQVVIELETRFPLVSEVLYQRFSEGDGPVAGAILLLAARVADRDLDNQAIQAALAVELLAMFPVLLTETVNRPRSDASKLNNNFAILAADFVVSRALVCATRAGAAVGGAIAAAGCSMCEAEVLQVGQRSEAATFEAYLDAAGRREGSLFALAARLGGVIGTASETALDGLDGYGRSLGCAFRLSNDLCAAVSGERARRDPPGVWRGGQEEAALKCEAMSEAARRSVATLGLEGSLAEICDLPGERARSTLASVETLQRIAGP